MTLNVAHGYQLPEQVATHKNAILAMSGAGKSNAAVVLAEEFYTAGIPWVAIDPKGDWYGVRANSTGTGDGLSVPVLGGLHGDIPLEPTAGKLVANLIADERLTCVLDTSEFDTREDQFRFLADFADTLLKRNRATLHMFLEEADEYLPQSARERGSLPRCLGAWLRVVKRGRVRGLGVTMITQRSAAIHKDVLNQADNLIAMRVTAPLDRKAIEQWVVGHGVDRELVESLPHLEDGEAWLWSPQKLKTTRRFRFRRRRTFDSGATPDAIGAAVKTASLASVDLDALKAQMSETVKRAEANDPARLKARIRDLERELAARSAEAVEKIVEVEVVPEWANSLFQVVEGLGVELRGRLERLDETFGRIAAERENVGAAARLLGRATKAPAAAAPARSTGPRTPARSPAAPTTVDRTRPDRASRRTAEQPGCDGDVHVNPKQRQILAALVQHGPLERNRLALTIALTPTGGTYNTYLSRLRSGGLITGTATIEITDAGRACVGAVEPLPTGPDLIAWWCQHPKINAKQQAILWALYERGPIGRDELAAHLEMTASGGTYNTYLSRLRSLGLIVGTATLDLADGLR